MAYTEPNARPTHLIQFNRKFANNPSQECMADLVAIMVTAAAEKMGAIRDT